MIHRLCHDLKCAELPGYLNEGLAELNAFVLTMQCERGPRAHAMLTSYAAVLHSGGRFITTEFIMDTRMWTEDERLTIAYREVPPSMLHQYMLSNSSDLLTTIQYVIRHSAL
jgi:hypothetical protein